MRKYIVQKIHPAGFPAGFVVTSEAHTHTTAGAEERLLITKTMMPEASMATIEPVIFAQVMLLRLP